MPFLEVCDVSKSFGQVAALRHVSFEAEKPEVVAIMGENGAGKTTIANVLFGLYQPDAGHVRIGGKTLAAKSPIEALNAGIGMIHQHFHLVDTMTAAENIRLGLPAREKRKATTTSLRKQAASYGFEIDFEVEVGLMPVGVRQRVEILKVLHRDVSILILDEPTSVLAPNEVDGFLQGVSNLRDEGKTVLFVTHKLDEVMQVADRVLVMRDGGVVAMSDMRSVTPQQLSSAMIGREFETAGLKRRRAASNQVVLDVSTVSAQSDRGTSALRDLSLEVKAGEILGVAGVDGNGQRELSEVIAGLRSIDHGAIRLDGKDISDWPVGRRQAAGIGFAPEDRHAEGLVLSLSVAENLVFRKIDSAPNSKNHLLDRKGISRRGTCVAERFDIRPRNVQLPASALSGGNQQKIVLARELEAAARLLVVAQPTKGLDVGAIEFVQQQIAAAAERGIAVLYISTELEHILEIADRVVVISSGSITGNLVPDQATAERVGLLMGGSKVATT